MAAQPSIRSVSFEQHASGRGIDIPNPRISWTFTAASNWTQSAYELEITRGASSPEVYRVKASDSVLVPWPSKPLQSREIAKVRVRSYGGPNNESTEWSSWSVVECGLLSSKDWTARAITSPVKQSEGPLRPIRFRKTFKVSSDPKFARLYITSLGVFQAYINGVPVGDHCMAPGWTSYHHRLNYEIFDVAPLLRVNEENVIAVEVAEGWWATRLGFLGGRRFLYGDEMALIAQLEIKSDTDQLTVVSDSSWKTHVSSLITSEIYDGEVFDAREEQEGWNTQDFSQEASWEAVGETKFPETDLVSQNAPPVRVTEVVKPKEIITTPSGKTIIDFGQNLVGRIRIPSISNPAGHIVTLVHAEVLENQELGTRPLRIAKCTDTIISAGTEIRDWAPKFTFHGFRYVQVDGVDASILNSFVAEVMHTDLVRTGWFNCSHEVINKLHQNATWSMRGNFLSIPTDCPQRDERLGWTGDIQVFGPSASFLYNTAGMLGDWLKDVAAEQLEHDHGIPPFVIPNAIPEKLWPTFPQAVWDDVTVLLPWTLYQSYGDAEILRRQYPSMKAWVDKGILRGPDNLWEDTLFQLGDWLDPTAPPESPGNARTDGTLVADAYLVHVTRTISEISAILNETADAERYSTDYKTLKTTFQQKYISPAGLLVGDTQTGLALSIFFDLLENPAQLAAAGARLARLVRKSSFQVSTGFAGTPIITHALTKAGYPQLAYRMLQEKSCPSWMYPITMGATTIWERWDSMRPDGSINPGEMTSFNHYALGSIINWMHRTVAGVSPLEPGWKSVLVKPVPGGTVTAAEAKYNTAYGRLECKWVLEGTRFKLDLIVPPNSSAKVLLPGESEESERLIGSGAYVFETSFDSQVGWPPKALVPPMWDPVDSFIP